MIIREEQPTDILSMAQVVEKAFSHGAEARLVEALRAGGGLSLSLVAELDDQVKGHIAFLPVTVDSPAGALADRTGVARFRPEFVLV